jgi:hypothetical protein
MALTTKHLYVLLVLGTIWSYAFLGYYYYKGLLSLDQYLKASLVALLSLLSTIVLLSRHRHQKIAVPGFNIEEIACLIPYIVFISSIMDVHLFGHLDIFSVLSLLLAFTILTLSKRDLDIAVFGVATLVMIIAVLYGIYTPSFGNDTWRDAVQAMQIVERGGLRDLTMVHEAYPFPLVSILYVVYSIVTNVDTIWSSNVMGILYTFLLTLWIHVLSRKLNTEHHQVASLLALTTPLIVVWSVWFIPQAYALLMALPLLFLKLHIIIVMILTLALVFGHGGMALWTLGIFIVLFIFMKMIKAETSAHTFLQQLNIKLALFLIIFSIYATYTVILMVLKGAVTNVFEAVMAFLRGERILIAAPSIQVQAPITSILGVIPIAILVTLGLIRMLEENDISLSLLTFISLAELAVVYIGAVAFPALDLPRYLGLGSTTLLAILSPQAFESLTRRGKLGAGYAYALLFLAILSFGFAGTLMPENPYTANPYSLESISGLITYDEAQELDNIAFKLCCNNYLLDWRSGTYIGYKYLWIQPLSRGFYNSETQSFFTYAGSCGLLVTPEYLTSFNGVLIFRQSSLNMLEAYSPGTNVFLNNIIDKVSMLYMSSQIRVILFR